MRSYFFLLMSCTIDKCNRIKLLRVIDIVMIFAFGKNRFSFLCSLPNKTLFEQNKPLCKTCRTPDLDEKGNMFFL